MSGHCVRCDGPKVPTSAIAANQGTNLPTRSARRCRTMFAVSMYVDMLSSALDTWVDELTGTPLIDYTLVCRADMLATRPHHGDTAYSLASAAEIAYDRALIKLCESNDVAVMASSSPSRDKSGLALSVNWSMLESTWPRWLASTRSLRHFVPSRRP